MAHFYSNMKSSIPVQSSTNRPSSPSLTTNTSTTSASPVQSDASSKGAAPQSVALKSMKRLELVKKKAKKQQQMKGRR